MSKSGISARSMESLRAAEQASGLMPYGSMRHVDLVAKVGGSAKVQRAALSPYGAIENVDLAAKVGVGGGKVDRKALSGSVESRRVVRLNRAG